MSTRTTATWVGLIWICVGACGGDAGPAASGWTGAIRDSAGVALVTNEGTAAGETGWSVVEERRIGTTAGDPDYQFGQIAGVGVTGDGRMFVLDQQAQHLKVFSPEGEILATLGGPGSGPGEFGIGAGPVLVGAGDTVIVPDITNQRVNRFTPEGESAGSFRMAFDQGIPVAWQDRPTGEVISQDRPFAFPGQEAPDSMDVIVERGPDGTPRDTLFRTPSGKTVSFASGTQELTLFSPEPIWTPLGTDRLVFGVNDEYRLQLYDSEGRLERVVTMPFQASEVTADDQQFFIDALVEIWETLGVPPEAIPTLRAGIGFADYYPAYLQFRAGPGETLWVQHIVTPADLSPEERQGFNPLFSLGSSEWDVFDAEGRLQGQVSMPVRFQPLRFSGDRIYGVWRDELDVQYVMVLRIEGLPGD